MQSKEGIDFYTVKVLKCRHNNEELGHTTAIEPLSFLVKAMLFKATEPWAVLRPSTWGSVGSPGDQESSQITSPAHKG